MVSPISINRAPTNERNSWLLSPNLSVSDFCQNTLIHSQRVCQSINLSTNLGYSGRISEWFDEIDQWRDKMIQWCVQVVPNCSPAVLHGPPSVIHCRSLTCRILFLIFLGFYTVIGSSTVLKTLTESGPCLLSWGVNVDIAPKFIARVVWQFCRASCQPSDQSEPSVDQPE